MPLGAGGPKALCFSASALLWLRTPEGSIPLRSPAQFSAKVVIALEECDPHCAPPRDTPPPTLYLLPVISVGDIVACWAVAQY